ncbi:MAG: 4-hydroxy-tetrahydrodipicolinate synthase [Rhabdochlamydiaceae bacterium]|nr:4-hydroxy-tetrahydrodipicolinate synthase [Rhabdochlamydiaceae bacterium]
MRGAITALATPFDEEGNVDFSALERLVMWQIEEGIDGIVLCGTTGESPSLSDEEMFEIFRIGMRVAKGRIPIIAGTGSNSTSHAVYLTQRAKEIGVDGCLVVLPYYNRPTPEGCFAHYRKLDEVGLPMIVYHHPGRCGIRLPQNVLKQISELPSVIGIKEASGDLDFTIELIRSTEKPIFASDDSLALAIMAHGGAGVISIVANVIPKEWSEFAHLMREGRMNEAKEVYDRVYPLLKALVLETNPQCVKYALSLLGKCSCRMRLPLIEPREENKRLIEAVYKEIVGETVLMC